MGVPRAKKPKPDKYTLAEVIAMYERRKIGMYVYLNDKFKLSQADIEELDLFNARTSLALAKGDYTIEKVRELGKDNGLDIDKVFKYTTDVLNKESVMKEWRP